MKVKELDKKPQKASLRMDPTTGGRFFSVIRTKEDGSEESVRPNFKDPNTGASLRQNIIDGKIKDAEIVPVQQAIVTRYNVNINGLTICQGETTEIIAQ